MSGRGHRSGRRPSGIYLEVSGLGFGPGPRHGGSELLRTGDVGSNRKIQRPTWEGSATPNIAIVGAGFGGIGLGALLRRSGIDSFTIYDKADHVGGTWWHNQYPGAEVDTVSYVYSYPFKPYAWTRSHARRAELLRYLEDTVEEFGLRSHLQLGVAVESADWNDETHTLCLATEHGGERALPRSGRRHRLSQYSQVSVLARFGELRRARNSTRLDGNVNTS